ncbi:MULTISPECIES: MoaD/ThiS family protein [unclassified Paenibacillus]|uniref:MoaD/ThiS family protein n=1 Tax=unclassified Paenibacillus TaxID=185978 RepID=UPI00241D981C|nr:MoaD/ThiS family protein [Paenibacillus amylolyticus]WFR64119.1 MoaD/ThiS family protein [Paenibacillus amylolyticus]
MITVILPQFLTSLARNQQEIQVEVTDLAELKNYLASSFPALKEKLWESNGTTKRNVLFVLNDNLIKFEDYKVIQFKQDDELNIILQFAGG